LNQTSFSKDHSSNSTVGIRLYVALKKKRKEEEQQRDNRNERNEEAKG